nr:ferredoxin reductase [Motilibacter deserti]
MTPVRWQPAEVSAVHAETQSARTLTLRVEGWAGHLPGQHVDVRLTAADGYTATRSYSISSAPAEGELEITVDEVRGGEVSPYLVRDAAPGDAVEVRGPLGGWFVWSPDSIRPLQLVAGGSGIAPLMSMLRARAAAGSTAPARLLYSVRRPGAAIFAAELERLAAPGSGLEVTYAYTRAVPPGWPRPAGRVDARLLAEAAWPADRSPDVYVCGPTGFVETAADLLVAAGHSATDVRTERFGPTGSTS